MKGADKNVHGLVSISVAQYFHVQMLVSDISIVAVCESARGGCPTQ